LVEALKSVKEAAALNNVRKRSNFRKKSILFNPGKIYAENKEFKPF